MDEYKEESLAAEADDIAGKKESTDLSNLYTDELQKSVVSMQKSADTYTERYHEKPFGATDIITDVLSFVISVGVAFAWTLVMLLIISFVARSAWSLQIEGMLIISGIVSFAVAVIDAVKKARKYSKYADEKRRYKESSQKDDQLKTF